jgi:uncharacterized membrane protein YsdA (DUF1294 family)/cold shock CspA family protein
MPARSSRLEGILTSWDDQRGFGFVTTGGGGESVFVHISAYQSGSSRPEVGDVISFERGAGPDGRPQARNVLGPGAGTLLVKTTRTSGFIALGAFIVLLLAVDVLWLAPLWINIVYLVMSLITFALYARDKNAALAHAWRTPETTLLLAGLVGGWPGAIVAQQRLHHKTRKASFRRQFWATVVANVLVLVAFASGELAVWVGRLMTAIAVLA